ncbi:MAG: hypothetical protein PHE75_03350 [Candidatus Cloacimonas acidaminovorans]|nr:hypothetical protein [Candidatus Cloacimonas acidaminovorans]
MIFVIGYSYDIVFNLRYLRNLREILLQYCHFSNVIPFPTSHYDSINP